MQALYSEAVITLCTEALCILNLPHGPFLVVHEERLTHDRQGRRQHAVALSVGATASAVTC